MVDRKLARIECYKGGLEQVGVEYRPIVFACFGRPHGDAVRLINTLAKQHARRKRSEQQVEKRRLMNRVTTEIWRRAARMVRLCTPEAVDADDADATGDLDTAMILRIGHPGTSEQGLLDEFAAAAPPSTAAD